MHYKQFFSILGVLLLCAISAKGQYADLKKEQVNKDIRLSLPEDFTAMSDQDIQAKYISYRSPIALYTNPNRTVDFGINLSVTHWEPHDLPLLQEFYENSIRTLYSQVEFLKKDIEAVNDIRYAVFEFVSTVTDESIVNRTSAISKYTLIYYAIVNNKTILFNFTCPASDREMWQETAQEIMNSIKIKKTL